LGAEIVHVTQSGYIKSKQCGEIVSVKKTFQPEAREDAFNTIIKLICNLLKYNSSLSDKITTMLLDRFQRGVFIQKFNEEVASIYIESVGVLVQPKIDYWSLMIFLNNPSSPEVTEEIYNKLMSELRERNYSIMGKNSDLSERVYSYQTFDMLVSANIQDVGKILGKIMRKTLIEFEFEELDELALKEEVEEEELQVEFDDVEF
jgi:hypothetical protein